MFKFELSFVFCFCFEHRSIFKCYCSAALNCLVRYCSGMVNICHTIPLLRLDLGLSIFHSVHPPHQDLAALTRAPCRTIFEWHQCLQLMHFYGYISSRYVCFLSTFRMEKLFEFLYLTESEFLRWRSFSCRLRSLTPRDPSLRIGMRIEELTLSQWRWGLQ